MLALWSCGRRGSVRPSAAANPQGFAGSCATTYALCHTRHADPPLAPPRKIGATRLFISVSSLVVSCAQLSGWWLALASLALFEPIAVAVQFEDVDVVGQSVEQRTGQPLGPEHAGPLVERQIAGDDGGAALVALAEDLEQQLGAGCRKGYIAEFINDQRLVTGQLALQSQQTLLVFGLDQLMDQSGGRDEADRQALLAGRQPQSESNMGLPRAAVADRNHVLSASDVLTAGKLQHQCLVERRDRRKLETVQALHRREPRLLDAALDHPLFPVDQFELGQAQQITRVVDAFGSALLGKLVVFAQEARQPECLQVMGEQKLGRVAHDEAPVRRSR